MARSFVGSLMLGACLTVTVLAEGVAGQVVELGDARCPACRISLEPVVTLGEPDGPGMLEADVNSVALDSRGRFFVFAGGPYFWVFEPDGTPIRRVGRQGGGPGEFQRVTGIVMDSEDSVYVFDPGQGRLSVYSPALELVRTNSTTNALSGDGSFIDGVMVLNQGIRTPERLGYPLHVVDRDGRVSSSFGTQTPGPFPLEQRTAVEWRETAPAGDGTVWSARVNEYGIERWDPAGRLVEALARDVPWFPAWQTPENDVETAPVPLITGISVQGDTLWVMIAVPGPRWREGVAAGERRPTIIDRDIYRNSVIEAIDLRTRDVIASTRFPELLSTFAGPGLVVDMGLDPERGPVVSILRPRIVEP
jgi:hypothetical protein